MRRLAYAAEVKANWNRMYWHIHSAKTYPCRRCEGSGKLVNDCNKCDGRGTFMLDCKKCDGSGKHKYK